MVNHIKSIRITVALFVGALLLFGWLWLRQEEPVVQHTAEQEHETASAVDTSARADTPKPPTKVYKSSSVIDVEEMDYFARAQEVLKLIMISRDPYEPSNSKVTFQDMEFRKRRVVKIHEEILDYPGVTVEDVQNDTVVIKSEDGRLASLELLETAPTPTEEEIAARFLEDPRPTVFKLEDIAAYQQSRRTQEGFLASAQASPEVDSEGRFVGVKLWMVNANSIYDQLGVTPNDVLIEVNGVRAEKIEDTELMLDQLVNSNYLEIVLLKADGSRQVREVYLSDTPNG